MQSLSRFVDGDGPIPAYPRTPRLATGRQQHRNLAVELPRTPIMATKASKGMHCLGMGHCRTHDFHHDGHCHGHVLPLAMINTSLRR